ncbi:MAG: 8-oxo-dGTP diphosphatase, partial [Lachnospiraceae bacterium]|nr:8-oxo-dGTP diphosphatase [Lachnospiraceae bacterium]
MKNTTLCYIEKDGCYLMLLRNKKENDVNRGKWIGVGGHFEEGESPQDCLLREVAEETGLTLTGFVFRGIVTFIYGENETEYMHLFTSDSFTGDLHECDEGELKWIRKEEIEELDLWEGDRLFMPKLIAGEKDIFMKLTYEGDRLVDATDTGVTQGTVLRVT